MMRTFALWVVIAILAVAAFVANVTIQQSGRRGNITGPDDREGERRMGWSDGGTQRTVRYRGEITASEDNRDVKEISPNGYLILSEGGFLWAGKQLSLRAAADGTIERKFFVNGREKPYEPEGPAWLALTLPDLIRRGFGADARVQRILKSAGVSGVLDEIATLESNSARRAYFSALFDHGKPVGKELATALTQAGKEISSDYELREFLSNKAMHAVADKQAAVAFFDAAASIDSDYEMARLLIDVAETRSLDSIREPYFRVMEKVDSDYEHRRVLNRIVDDQTLSPETLSAVLRSADKIDNDHEMASLLIKIAERHRLEGTVRDRFMDAAKGISSEHERGRVMAVLGTSTPRP